MALEDFEVHSKGPVAKLAGCDDREAADALRGRRGRACRARRSAEAGEGSLYRVDLVGLDVVDEEWRAAGPVEGFFETGDTSVMVVAGGGRERLIPFVADFVKAVDRDAGRITVDWKPDYDA